jgi:hypothetical protein
MSGAHADEAWGKQRARWYSEGLRFSDYAEKVVGMIEPIVRGCSSLLDIGAGCGALCIPLTGAFERVVALDASAAMLDELQAEAASRGIDTIQTEVARWDAAEGRVGSFDVVLVANVPGVLDNPSIDIPRLERHANRFVFLVLGTPGNANKFFLNELWPLIHGGKPARKPDYFSAYSALYEMNIFANVAVVEYDFDQPFSDVDEAVLFWKDHMRLTDDRWDDALREFLEEKLEPAEGRLWARMPKQSAVIWWETALRRK